MPKNEINSIRNIVSKLKREEISSVKSHIASLHQKFGEYKPKTLILFELICDITKVNSDEEIKAIVCPDASKNTFLKLLIRLREKIYEALLFDINLKRKTTYSEYATVLYELKKKRVLAQILVTRGLLTEGIKLINSAIKDANDYFLYNDIVSLLFLKHAAVGRTFSTNKIELLENEIMAYTELRNTTEVAEFYYSSIVLLDRHNTNTNTTEYKLAVKAKIESLQNLPSVDQSPPALYYLTFLKMLSERVNGNYASFEVYAHKILAILNDFPGLQNKPRLANANIQLADASIFNYKFKEALVLSEKVKEYLVKNTRNYFEIEAFQFHAYFYDNKLSSALELIDRILDEASEKINDIVFANKLYYYKAYTLFIEKNYAESNRTLAQVKELDTDKEGWNIGIRILQIMNRLETEMYDESDALISNLHRHITKTLKGHDLRKRDIVILNILKKLSNKGFDFKAVLHENRKQFDLLSSNDLDLKWNFFSPELIPFHRWFEDKTLKHGHSLQELIAKR